MSNGLSIFGIIQIALTVVFVTLKVLEVVSWSWLWVFSPLLLEIFLYVFMIIFGLFCIQGGKVIDRIFRGKNVMLEDED